MSSNPGNDPAPIRYQRHIVLSISDSVSFAVQVLKRPLLVLPARFGPITAEEGDVDTDLKDRLGRLGLCACVTLTMFLSSSQNYSPTGIPEQISIVALRRCRRDPRAGKPCAAIGHLCWILALFQRSNRHSALLSGPIPRGFDFTAPP